MVEGIRQAGYGTHIKRSVIKNVVLQGVEGVCKNQMFTIKKRLCIAEQ